jgi:hypothetical protein
MATSNMSDWGWDKPLCFCAGHAEECGCSHCHEHKEHEWRQWTIYPPCEPCLMDLSLWLAENTDYFELLAGRAA